MALQTKLAFLFLLLLFPFSSILAQEDDDFDIILSVELRQGSTILGKQLAWTDTHIVLEIEGLGKLNISMSNVKKVTIVNDNYKNGKFLVPMANSTQNFFSPSGYGLLDGEINYKNTMLFYNQFDFGIVDYFSLGFGFESISLFASRQAPAFIISPKFTFPIEENKLNIGVGAFLLNVPDTDRFIDISVLYGATTYGTRDRNFTVGLGFAATEDGFSSTPGIVLNGIFRLSNRTAILSDNYAFPTSDGSVALFSLGFRLIRTKVMWDINFFMGTAFENNAENTTTGFGPIVSLIVPLR